MGLELTPNIQGDILKIHIVLTEAHLEACPMSSSVPIVPGVIPFPPTYFVILN
jgi:hypothetical protein